MFPEQLYRLRPGEIDEPNRWLLPRFRTGSQGASAISLIAVIFTVPEDSFLHLTTGVVQVTPGAAQIATAKWIDITRDLSAAAGTIIALDEVNSAAAVTTALNFSGLVIVPPGFSVRANASFDAGAAVNNVTGWISGLLVPVGTMQRGG